MTGTTYTTCHRGHTVYPATDTQTEWCECHRTTPVGADTIPLYERRTRSWCGLPAGQRKTRG